MIGIGIATATAGIIVGAVSQTGVGSALADVVEVLSGGNILAILFLTAILSLILGMGLPTTANYIVVSALLAPVIVTLGQQNGLIVPLIAVHLFVFYFGIMADVTPPVGLASFAAAAVSGGDPIKTGVVAFFYSLAHRRAAVPVHLQHRTAADQRRLGTGYLHLHRRDHRDAAVRGGDAGLVPRQEPVLRIDRPAADRLHPVPPGLLDGHDLARPTSRRPRPRSLRQPLKPQRAKSCASASRASTIWAIRSNSWRWLPIDEGATGEERLENAGLAFRTDGDKMIIDDVAFGSAAQDAGLDWDQEVLRVLKPVPQPSKYLMFIPALLVLALIVFLQRGRAAAAPRREAAA